DFRHSYAETFNELTGQGTIGSRRRAVFKTGSVTSKAYANFFHIPAAPSNEVISWILINVPNDIDVHSPLFKVWVSGAKVDPNRVPVGDEGTPDPDAIGVLGPFLTPT